MASKVKTINIFCAKCQKETEHTGQVDLNGEFVFTCLICEGFFKVPAGYKAEDIKAHFEDHKKANEGQVSVAESEATLDELLS